MADRIRILLVDDHAMVRRGMRDFLALHEDLEVVGEAADGLAALEATASLLPDVVIMDLLMPEMDGIAATAEIKARHPAVEVIALTSFVDEDRVTAAIEAGASGFLLKDAEADDLANAIRAAVAGEVHLDPAVAGIVARGMRERSGSRGRAGSAGSGGRAEAVAGGPARGRGSARASLASLTTREREVLGGVARGLSNKAIADELGMAERTARTHVSNILAKLGLTSRTQAALFAVQHGIGPGPMTTDEAGPGPRDRRAAAPPGVADPDSAGQPTEAPRPGAFDVAGPVGAPAIVFIHGTRLTRKAWTAQMTGLSDAYRTIAIDLPGHGALADEPFTLAGATDQLAEVIDREAGGRAIVVGLSLGGFVAMDLAARSPARVRGLVIAGATAEPTGLRRLAFLALAWVLSTFDGRGLNALNRWFFRARFPPADRRADRRRRVLLERWREALRAIVGESFLPRLAAYPGPTLVIEGSLDLPLRLMERTFVRTARHGRLRPARRARRTCPTSTVPGRSMTPSGGSLARWTGRPDRVPTVRPESPVRAAEGPAVYCARPSHPSCREVRLRVRKAVFPAAGWGTRFLPATKAQPKEMLPLVDKPIIQYAVEEAVAAGIEQVIIVTSSQKRAIEDHFDLSYELEHLLEEKGDIEMLRQVRAISDLAQVAYIRQKEQLGLGHAVLMAKDLIGHEPFAVILPDDVVIADRPCIGQLIHAYTQTHSSVVAVMEVPHEETSRYGVIASEPSVDPLDHGRLHRVTRLVEKPAPEDAPSDLAIIGRYILTPKIFDKLEQTQRGAGGEIQLTDAIADLMQEQAVYAYEFEGIRYDAGTTIGWLKASVELTLQRPDLAAEFRAYLRQLEL